MYEHISYERDGDVGLIRLNDPKTLNAMSTAMGLELVDAFGRAEREGRAIFIGAVGRAFCSGANLFSGAFKMDDPARDAGVALERAINPLLTRLRHSEVPVVTAIRGAAAGVGCGLALAGDLIVAGQSAYFYQAFCKVGLSPDGGSSYFLAKTIGRVRAMEMMMLGERLPAEKALAWGLVSRVVPDDEVDIVALELAQRLAAGPRSLGLIREAGWAALDAGFEDQLATERNLQRESGRTEDFAEGVAAFREKRDAIFKGR